MTASIIVFFGDGDLVTMDIFAPAEKNHSTKAGLADERDLLPGGRRRMRDPISHPRDRAAVAITPRARRRSR